MSDETQHLPCTCDYHGASCLVHLHSRHACPEVWRSCISCDQTFLLTPEEVARFNVAAVVCEHCERLARWAACDDGRDHDEFIDF
jgi:hypothetical protein